MKHYDILIVGGGLVGLSLAASLKALPLRIGIVEAVEKKQRLQTDFDARTLALSYGSQRIFAAMGIWPQLAEQALAIKKIHVSDSGHFGATRLEAAHYHLPALGYVIEFNHLLPVLQQTCEQADNIEWLCPATLAALEVAQEKATAELTTEQGKQTVTADLVVAADGGDSVVRRLQNITTKKWQYGQTALVANIGLQRDHQFVAYERFTAQGPVAMLPISGQRSALVWSAPPETIKRLLALSDAEFLQRLQKHFGYRLGRLTKVGKRASFPLTLVRAQEQIRPHVVLIGNASHTLHPIAGQGFNLGLRDVASLAQVITTALNTNKVLGALTTLQQYVKQRQWDQRKMIGFTDGLTRIFSNNYFPISLVRDLGLVAVDNCRPLKNILLKNTMGVV